MARLFLQNESASLSSSGASSITGSNGQEIVTIGTGTFTFDASFGRGGDTVILAGNAGGYNVTRSNTMVTLTSDDGLTTILIPAGLGGTTIQFADATRTLQIANGQVLLGAQAIGQGAAQEVADGPGGNTQTPPNSYILTVDQPAAVSEGNAGTRALTFTVSLDRAPNAPVTINYSTTTGGTATPNADFQPVSGTLTFAAGQTTATVSVLVNGDTAQENDETLQIKFSGSALAGEVLAIGTILNDDLGEQLTVQNDIISGTAANEVYEAFNNTLNAGDRINGGEGQDELRLSVSGTAQNYSGFRLTGVETVEVTNDSNGAVALDLSGSTGIRTLRASNGSQGVAFNQVTELANIELDELTNPTAPTTVQFQNNAVSGANDSVELLLNNSNSGAVRIGSVVDANGGIENVVLKTTATSSTISQLDTDLTKLTVEAQNGGGVTIASALNNSVREIDASASAGRVEISAANASAGVTYTGSSGVDVFRGSGNADIISTGEGDDNVNGNGGSDVIDLGNGNNTLNTGSSSGDVVTVTGGSGIDTIVDGAGNATITTNGGNDDIDIRAGGNDKVYAGEGDDIIRANQTGALTSNDIIDGGEGTDTLYVNAGLSDVAFTGVSSVETLRVQTTLGTTTLQGNDSAGTKFAQAAGISTVYLENSGSDTLDARTFTTGLTVFATSGTDEIRLGRGADTVNMQGDNSLTNFDTLRADGTGAGAQGRDTLNLSGDTIVSNNAFSGFEQINLGSARGTADLGNAYNITLSNGNAPTAGEKLTIDGSGLSGATGGTPALTAETVQINAQAVNGFELDVTTGGANDVIISGTAGGTFRTNAGNDSVTLTGGVNIVETGEGDDIVVTQGGANTIDLGDGNDFATLGSAVDKVSGGKGDDIFAAGQNLTSADTINGGEGTDTLRIGSRAYTDADFTNVTQVEVLDITSNTNATLGSAASNSGFTKVVSSSNGASTIDASGYGSALTFDLTAGGNDVVKGTAFDDVVVLGTGDNDLDLGAGQDRVVVSGNELTALDKISGGAVADGVIDTIELDNTNAAVTAVVDLNNVKSIERYEFTASGDRTVGTDADNNALSFTGGNVGSLTGIAVDASAITDGDDSVTVTLAAALGDADYGFTIKGAGADVDTNVVKLNYGINNNIVFDGQAGDDNLLISGSDLGGGVTFDGGAGTNSIRQLNGSAANRITDDSYRNVSNAQILAAAGPSYASSNAVHAVLGSEAGESGLNRIIGGSDSDSVVFDAGFARGIEVDLLTSSGGNDSIDASAIAQAFTFRASATGFDALDVLKGGSVDGDTLYLRASGSGTASNLTSVSNIETIILDKNPSALAVTNDGANITLDTKIAEVQSTGGVQTVDATALDSNDTLILTVTNSTALDANYDIRSGAGNDSITTGQGADEVHGGNGNDTIRSGAGNDTVYGDAGNDDINGGAGDDTLYGGDGIDRIAGGDGADTIEGGAGDDLLHGGNGIDTIRGGDGADRIYGGAGADIISGGAGDDIYYYKEVSESSTSTARDTILDFASGDKIDIRSIAGSSGQTINFAGNVANFGAASGAVVAGGTIDVVFQQDDHVLWFDIDNNGVLNGNDLQIVLDGVTAVTADQVFAGFVANSANTTVGFASFEQAFNAGNLAIA